MLLTYFGDYFRFKKIWNFYKWIRIIKILFKNYFPNYRTSKTNKTIKHRKPIIRKPPPAFWCWDSQSIADLLAEFRKQLWQAQAQRLLLSQLLCVEQNSRKRNWASNRQQFEWQQSRNNPVPHCKQHNTSVNRARERERASVCVYGRVQTQERWSLLDER